MELNREQILTDLTKFRHRILHSKLAELVYGKEMLSIINAISLIKELAEENEYLKQQNEIYAVLNKKMESICESYVFQYGTAVPKEIFFKKERECTIRKMQERFIAEIEQTPNANEHFIKAWKSKIDQIAKEMIGEINGD